MQLRSPIFDAHFHIGPYGSQQFEGRSIRPVAETLDHHHGNDCAAYLSQNRLSGGIIVPTYLSLQTAAFDYNALVIAAVEEQETLFGGLWVSPLEILEDHLSDVLNHPPHPKIRALKIASNTWEGCGIAPAGWSARVRRNVEQILEYAASHNLIIHFHTGYLPGADPRDFDSFMKVYGTRARYQLVHMGEAIAPAFRFVPLFVEWIKSGYDVYTDTSIVPGFAPDWLLRLLDAEGLGFDRVFFATDSPWGRFPSEYWKVEGLDIPEEVKAGIFFNNAVAAYGIEDAF
ncbi:MAG: amidohydrolase family protein [Rhodothermales bacterium]